MPTDLASAAVVESFFYSDEAGTPVARIDRIEPGWSGRRKEFLPHLADGGGGYLDRAGLNGAKLPLYRAAEVRAAIASGDVVFLGEGERKCDRLRKELRAAGSGGAVTTISGGAMAPLRDDLVMAFKGATRVIVLADSDPAGRRAARNRAQKIADAFATCEVRIIDLFPKRDDGSDVDDWFAEGHSLLELHSIVEAARTIEQSPAVPQALPAKTVQENKRGNPANKNCNGWITVGELLREPEQRESWLVDGLLVAGGTSLLAAKPKVGKSTLAQNLAFSVARGEPFLGRAVKRGPVLYLALEENRGELRRHFRAMGTSDIDEISFFIARTPEGAFEWLEIEVSARRPVLIVIDTFQRFARLKDINDYASVTNAMDSLTQLSRDAGAHLMLTHHAKKTGGDNGDAVLGSTGFFGAVDTLLEMRRRHGTRTLSSIQRYGQDLEEVVICLEPSTYRISSAGSMTGVSLDRLGAEMISILENAAEPLMQSEIFGATEGRRTLKLDALRMLVESQRISRDGEGKKGDPYLYSARLADFKVSGTLVPSIQAEREERKLFDAVNTDSDWTENEGCQNSSILVPDIDREPQYSKGDTHISPEAIQS